MSFWNLSDSNDKIDTSGSFESGGGNIEPIPSNTQVKAAIDEAKWDDYDGDQFISLRWVVLAPAEYKNRKVFQKVRVLDPDSKKADKAKKMLAAIATNAGGGLLKASGKPNDADLQKHLLQKPMALLLQVWEIEKDDGSVINGNWISQVSPLKKQQPAPQPEPVPEQDEWQTEGDDNDPPF